MYALFYKHFEFFPTILISEAKKLQQKLPTVGLDQPNTLPSETFENLMLCLFLLYPKANRFVSKIPLEVVLYLQYHNSKATRRATDHNTFRSYLYLLSQNMFLHRK